MTKMSKTRQLSQMTLLGLGLLLAACVAGQVDEEISSPTPPYDLEVTFDGLIAFVEDEVDGNPAAWALMVEADYGPAEYQEEDLPPCAWDEVQADPSRLAGFPPHKIHIRFREGQVQKCDQLGNCATLANPKQGEPIPMGADLRFETGSVTALTARLDSLASSSELQDTKQIPPAQADALDELASGLTDASPIHPHLAARVLLQTGEVEARPYPFKGAGGTATKYSFKSPVELSCVGATDVEFAEETVWTQSGLRHETVVKLGASGDEYRVTPTAGVVKVEILNAIQKAIDDPDWDGHGDARQLEAFRWFYRFAKNQPADKCSDSYFPCHPTVAVAGRKCPQKLFEE